MMVDFYGVAELYHKSLLQCILDYEAHNNKLFNKGMAYGNLGVAQIAGGKIDQGVSSLLAADVEDQDFIHHHDAHHILDGSLWEQFEDTQVFLCLDRLSRAQRTGRNIPRNHAGLKAFMKSLELPDRLVLETSVWAANDNWQHAQRARNAVHFRSRLLTILWSVCWLIESLLRKSRAGKSYLAGQQKHVKLNALVCALAGKHASYPDPAGYKGGAETTDEFVTYAGQILAGKGKHEARSLHCLVLTRNYISHHFDPMPSGQDWFPIYPKVLGMVLGAMFYLRSIKAL